MNKETVTRFKFFWAHQDREQEAWLRAMAQQGLYLENVTPLCVWTFRRGAPRDLVYRVDFGQADDGFSQLMEDAGWKLATTCTGWYYWCTPATQGREPEIFTDRASKIQKFQRLLLMLVCSAVPAFMLLITTDKGSLASKLSTFSLVLISSIYLVYFLVLAYTVLRLLLRIREERAPESA
ncbi:DUF2812 domain-containing protein [Massilia suwonensis]|uniref:DUF2812 domain-containing protein n=1 Tax=Massilia suwonensis TaxID=648895 RepID=A0ABW0MKG1_9BURK